MVRVTIVEGTEDEVVNTVRRLEGKNGQGKREFFHRHEQKRQEQKRQQPQKKVIVVQQKKDIGEVVIPTQSQEVSVIEDRIPRKVPKSQYVRTKQRGPNVYGQRQWLKQENQAVAAFYRNPENHWSNGLINRKKMEPFCKQMKRTPIAVSVHIIDLGLNKQLVRGTSAMHRLNRQEKAVKKEVSKDDEEKKGQYMMRREARIPTEAIPQDALRMSQFNKAKSGEKEKPWPVLLATTVPKEIQQSTFKFLAQKRGTLSYGSDAYVFGIDNAFAWAKFLSSVMMNVQMIADYLGVQNKFKVTGMGKQMTMSYQ